MFLPTDITLRPGDSGEHVSELQRRLAQRDLLGEGNISGLYDGATTQGVMDFQAINGLRTDGIAGPETLRRLISIGTNSDEGGGGSSSEEEEAKEQEALRERSDELAMNEELQAEQEKLSNEAVWGYGDDVAAQSEQGQQQLADLDRYNDVHDAALAEQALKEQEHVAAEQMEAQAEQEKPEQLQIDREGAKAYTVAEELEEQTELSGQGQEADKQPDGPGRADHANLPEGSIDRLADAPLHDAPTNSPAPQAPRDPELERTEAQLDAPSQQESQQEGQKLNQDGVQDRGTVPASELGGLTPDQTPGQQRERELAR